MAQAVGVIVSFPGLSISSNPSKGPIEGFSTEILNDYLVASKLNISMIEAESIGAGCSLHSNGNASCTGIYEKLQKCECDFSVFPLGLDVYDFRLKDIPVSLGPQIGSAPHMFACFNQTGESAVEMTFSMPNVDPASITLIALFLLSLLVTAALFKKVSTLKAQKSMKDTTGLNEWRRIRDRGVIKQQRQWKKSSSTERPVSWSEALKSRAICFFFASFFFILYSIVVSIAQTNQIVTDSPHYFRSVEEAALATSYKILALKGATPLHYFETSKKPIIRDLASTDSKRYQWFKTLEINDLSETFMRKPEQFFHISTISVMMTMKAMVCNFWFTNQDNPLAPPKVAPWFMKQGTYLDGGAVASYSRCINKQVKSRLNVMFHRMMQAHLFNLYSYNAAFRIPVAYESKNYLCVKNAPPYTMDHSSDGDDEEKDDTIGVLLILFTLPSFGFGMSVLVFCLELICTPPKKQNRSLQRISPLKDKLID